MTCMPVSGSSMSGMSSRSTPSCGMGKPTHSAVLLSTTVRSTGCSSWVMVGALLSAPDGRGSADAGGVGSAGQGVTAAYDQFVDLVKILSPRYFRPARAPHTTRLAQVQERLVHRGRPVPGLTTHQAKGGEWE